MEKCLFTKIKRFFTGSGKMKKKDELKSLSSIKKENKKNKKITKKKIVKKKSKK